MTPWIENDRAWRCWQRQIGTFNLVVTATSGGRYVPILEALYRGMAYRFYEGAEYEDPTTAQRVAEHVVRMAFRAALADLGDDGKEG